MLAFLNSKPACAACSLKPPPVACVLLLQPVQLCPSFTCSRQRQHTASSVYHTSEMDASSVPTWQPSTGPNSRNTACTPCMQGFGCGHLLTLSTCHAWRACVESQAYHLETCCLLTCRNLRCACSRSRLLSALAHLAATAFRPFGSVDAPPPQEVATPP